METEQFINQIQVIQENAKQAIIDFLKSNPSGPCVEVPDEEDIVDHGLDCTDWGDCDIWLTGVRLNDNEELEFKAEYCDTDDEYGNGGWDTLFSDSTLKVFIGMEHIYKFVIETAKKFY